MSEGRLGVVLTRRFRRVTWAALATYALLVIVIFAASAELALRRSLEQSADMIVSLLGAYGDGTGESGGVLPSALADRLAGMPGRVVITRTATGAAGRQQVYFVSPDVPARRIEGLPPGSSPDSVRAELLAAIADRGRWRFRALHRAAGEYDIHVVGNRESYLVALGLLVVATVMLLPLAALIVVRYAGQAVGDALQPLAQVTAEMQSIESAELDKRLASPTGQAEVTELAGSVNRMLERVDRAHRALHDFTADASHELRTPLTHLRAQVQWASADNRGEGEVRDALAAMERELERATKVLDDLLLIARCDNRRLSVECASFDLGLVLDEVREITEAMAEGRALTVELAPGPHERVMALGDADRTRRILLNLASNAVRYTPSGRITLALRRSGRAVGASVRDTGPGIPPEHVARVFDRFYRIDQSRSRASGGTGLGLAIARQLAELQQGRITVQSAPGSGSEFTMWLPGADTIALP